MDKDSLFEQLREDGTYSGPCELTLDNPVGQITGKPTVRVTGESRAEAEITIDGFQARPEYDNNLLAFLNVSLPRRDDERVVVPSCTPPGPEERSRKLSRSRPISTLAEKG